jgi:DNA-binding NarL/FixJ family response regulator
MAERTSRLLRMTPAAPLRLALVSGSALVLAGLRAGLLDSGEFDITLASRSVADARGAAFGAADVVVIDLNEDSEPEFAPADALAGPAFVLLHRRGAPASAWWQQGLSVLPNSAPIEQVAAAARAAAAGLVVCEPRFAAAVFHRAAAASRRDDGAAEPGCEPLTPREQQVLAQMAVGLHNREIAQALNISPHTAKFHVAQVIAKLDASSRTHAVAKGLRAGLLLF